MIFLSYTFQIHMKSSVIYSFIIDLEMKTYPWMSIVNIYSCFVLLISACKFQSSRCYLQFNAENNYSEFVSHRPCNFYVFILLFYLNVMILSTDMTFRITRTQFSFNLSDYQFFDWVVVIFVWNILEIWWNLFFDMRLWLVCRSRIFKFWTQDIHEEHGLTKP